MSATATATTATTKGLLGRWAPRRVTSGDTSPTAESALARGLGVEPLVARLLMSRGMPELAAAHAFVNPSLRLLHDPELLPGCDIAAQRLIQALDLGEPIVIYGDYDVDGITATAILFHILRTLQADADVRTYVPHRLDEGYGLNEQAIAELADAGARVIVSVDCGITATGPALTARERNVDLIITDHHIMPGEQRSAASGDAPANEPEFPDAFALVHPRLPVSDGRQPYPFGDLCGAGVAFKLAWRIAVLANGGERRVTSEMRELLLDLTALAGLGTIADVVPLHDENRLFARFGLQRFKSTGLVGLRALLEASSLSGERVSAEDAAFRLAPRLNACGRMGHAGDAVELMTSADESRAGEIATRLNAMNNDRRSTEHRITEHAAELAEAAGMTSGGRRAIVLAHEDWHAGVVGIVCSRLVERFNRPVILGQRCDDGHVKGSGRSVEGYNLHAAMAACAQHLVTFGGHDMAAGLKARADAFDAFAEAFCQHADRTLDDELMTPVFNVDCEATIDDLTLRAAEQLDWLGPFGRHNPTPSVLLRDATIRSCRPMGRGNAHADLRIESVTSGRGGSTRAGGAGWAPRMRLVGWGWGERADRLRVGTRIDALIRPQLNRWNGSVSVQAELIDARLHGE
jgi:single-stranded-DNA-specific exonuclease